jgi:hypothetical protein
MSTSKGNNIVFFAIVGNQGDGCGHSWLEKNSESPSQDNGY